MSKLNRKLISEKLFNISKLAKRDGQESLAIILVNLATIVLYNRPDVMGLVVASTFSAVDVAKEAALSAAPKGALRRPDDIVEKKLSEAASEAFLADEAQIASIIEFILSLRAGRSDELLKQLREVAESLSLQSLGKQPKKEVLIIDAETDSEQLS